jgi:hypothetical protein
MIIVLDPDGCVVNSPRKGDVFALAVEFVKSALNPETRMFSQFCWLLVPPQSNPSVTGRIPTTAQRAARRATIRSLDDVGI